GGGGTGVVTVSCGTTGRDLGLVSPGALLGVGTIWGLPGGGGPAGWPMARLKDPVIPIAASTAVTRRLVVRCCIISSSVFTVSGRAVRRCSPPYRGMPHHFGRWHIC